MCISCCPGGLAFFGHAMARANGSGTVYHLVILILHSGRPTKITWRIIQGFPVKMGRVVRLRRRRSIKGPAYSAIYAPSLPSITVEI
jgi:hypothetical protein